MFFLLKMRVGKIYSQEIELKDSMWGTVVNQLKFFQI